ncbi:MAG: phosphate ABC transporter substrate-binding protein [Caldilineae bacterium]|nr:phosphate ABC transporter substrate-binding protein [Anaerolineae bacterium]MCB9154428.1 phosphate ABC transporter substrate-binding protein [Caldilineae bacterium]
MSLIRRSGASVLLLILVLLASSACSRAGQSGSAEAGAGSGRAIQNKGSDTIVNLALAWAEAYREVQPDVSIAVTGGGSGTGIAALINGTVDIANASREMKESEIEEARANGFDPVEHLIAIDALAVIVNPENPVDRLSIDQLADIFTGRITNWKEVGGNDEDIVLVSRETNSGTHVYFLEEVVRKGDSDNTDIFAPQTLLMPSSVGITSEIQRNPRAIGYDGLGYVTEHEKMLEVAKDAGSPYVMPSVASGADGSYPIARGLYMYTAGEPTGAIADYIAWIKGPAGQQIVADLGFVPLTEE